MEQINTSKELSKLQSNNVAVLLYFSHNKCSVCQAIEPKIEHLLKHTFPLIKSATINPLLHPQMASQFQVYTGPTVLLLFHSKEAIRVSRNFSLDQLSESISRLYNLAFR